MAAKLKLRIQDSNQSCYDSKNSDTRIYSRQRILQTRWKPWLLAKCGLMHFAFLNFDMHYIYKEMDAFWQQVGAKTAQQSRQAAHPVH